MGNVYWSEQDMHREGEVRRSPNLLAIGDSWFWYPLPGGNLLTYLGPLLEPQGRVIYAVGNNGAEAVEYIDGKYRKSVRRALDVYGSGIRDVLFSGGGNDFAGINDLLPLLRGDCSQVQRAEACFLEGPGWPSLTWLMARMAESMTRLFELIDAKTGGATIYVHNYDLPYPDGRTVFGIGKGWLKESFDRAQVREDLRRDCIRLVLERLTIMQAGLARQSGSQVIQIDSHGLLSREDWANELHPTPGGFRRIAREAWQPVLTRQAVT